MAITLKVSDHTAVNFTTETNEAVFLEANNSGVTLTAEESESVSMSVESAEVTLEAESCIYIGGSGAPYSGQYEWTPTTETQTIPIIGKTATRNITINPIPNNYGLITWNGSTLTVS